MKFKCYFSIVVIIFAIHAKLLSQKDLQYQICYQEMKDMLSLNQKPSFKKAVFLCEKTYLEQKFNDESIQNQIEELVNLCTNFSVSNSIIYSHGDSNRVNKFASVFKILTDTIQIVTNVTTHEILPFRYDFDDIFGEKKWENMFVTKLLATRKGNCHSMPYLYKIICDELSVPCHLALAPNHIYIKHQSKKGGWYNTELTSASFPIDAWLMASGYITLESIQNGVYMDALNDKQCIALCVLDLAKGYDRKYPNNDGAFIIKCCDLALEHFPKYINAMLLKVETRKKQFEKLMKERNISTPSVLRLQKDGKMLWDDMNSLYTKVHKLGYRTMPEQMYVDWLLSLKKEREKYSNKQVIEMNKN